MTNPNDFFDGTAGGGAPTALLKNPGDFVHGEIVDSYQRDYVPFGKTEPEKNNDGTNRQQLVVIVQTALRNWQGVSKVPVVDPNQPNSPMKDPSEDDGKRAIYVPKGSNIHYAVGRAIAASGAAFGKGGTLGVKVFNLKDTGKGNPLKEHEAVYQGPSASSQFFDGGQQQAAPAQQQAPQAPPAQQQAYAQGSSFGGGDQGIYAQQGGAPAQQPFGGTPAQQQAAPAAQNPFGGAPAQAAPQTDPWSGQPAQQQAAPAAQNPFGGAPAPQGAPF